jgi:hypothetical protein
MPWVNGGAYSFVSIPGSSKYQLEAPNVQANETPFRLRVGVPRNQQRLSEIWISLYQNTAGNHFQIQAMSVTLNNVSEKQGKK